MPRQGHYQLNPTPTPQAEDEPSVVDDEIVAKITAGEDTAQLSDLSEGIEGSTTSTKGSSSFSSWYHRIAPLVRNRQVRILSIVNCILTVINLFIALLIFAFCFWLLGLKVKHHQLIQQDMPCLYTFGPWGDCTATCWSDNDTAVPRMSRKIDSNKLVMARGKGYAKCPANIKEGLVQTAPCNVFRCPERLSSYVKWTPCFYKNPKQGKAGGCYKMRILPLNNTIIEIDVPDLTADCSDDECPDHIA